VGTGLPVIPAVSNWMIMVVGDVPTTVGVVGGPEGGEGVPGCVVYGGETAETSTPSAFCAIETK